MTVTVKLKVPVFPSASVAVQVTVVTPIGNKELLSDEQLIVPVDWAEPCQK